MILAVSQKHVMNNEEDAICSDDRGLGCGCGGRVGVLQVEAGPGLGQLEVVLRLLPLGVALPPELGQLALQGHLLVVPGHLLSGSGSSVDGDSQCRIEQVKLTLG